ncbi:F-box protein At4g18380-like [Andrographis paniculata]|uniref:F-box protein At4g18380-like n=1 Tax=Andrographis paniculata TaxID=175694 RepID=UPI0021E757B6|nr:F-box protein At4g18380-like [Andrographis paniculata]
MGQEIAVDCFDRLPDEIVLSIFKKLQDAKSLCMSMAVCKRFRSIAPQVDEISLSIPKKKAAAAAEFRNPVVRVLMKPFNFISQLVKSRSKSSDENDLDFYSYYLHNEILKSFGEVRGLRLRLPCHGNRNFKSGKNGKPPKTFLKWKAEFGRDLHSCVILGAKSFSDKSDRSPESDPEARVSMPDEDLKLRIVWTISCLIAATARHYLIQETVKRQGTIQNVVVSDETNQGRLLMNSAQIEELRVSKGKGRQEEVPEPRSRVPALRMKMWFMDSLEVGDSGRVMEGATLVVIKPAAAAAAPVGGGDVLGFGDDDEGKMLEEAARKLMVAKKCYTLEMNSF